MTTDMARKDEDFNIKIKEYEKSDNTEDTDISVSIKSNKKKAKYPVTKKQIYQYL